MHFLGRASFIVLIAIVFCACTRSRPIPTFRLNLYSGIKEVAYLGERKQSILKRRWGKQAKPARAIASTDSSGLSSVINISELGVQVFFKGDVANLILIRPPFKGVLRSQKVFGDKPSGKETWRDLLISRFGEPESESTSSGLLRSRVFFYPWGDIVYNAVGPTEIALYRHPKIRAERRENVGSSFNMFSN